MDEEQVVKCGGTTLRIPERAAWACFCDYGHLPVKCRWVVVSRGVIFEGDAAARVTGSSPTPSPEKTHFHMSGPAKDCAKILERLLKRRVTVPSGLKGTVINKRLKGPTASPKKFAETIGLTIGDRLR